MLKGENVRLRLVKESDLTDLCEKWNDPQVRGEWYPVAFVPESIFRDTYAKTGFWTDDSQRMLITDHRDNMLGIIHCKTSFADCVELSYILFDTNKRKKGYMTEAVILFVDYLFNNRRLNRIQICVPLNNDASIRVAEKAGFIHEGIARGALFLNGEDVDLHVYSILKKEWVVMPVGERPSDN